MDLLEARTRLRRLLGDRKLAAPTSAPSVAAAAGTPFWNLGVTKWAIAFIYADGTSDRGPVQEITIGNPNVHPSISSIPVGADGSGVIGRLILGTKTDLETFYVIKELDDNETTSFVVDVAETDLDETHVNARDKTSDSELDELVNYYMNQVQDEINVIWSTDTSLSSVLDQTSYAVPASVLELTKDSSIWLDDEKLRPRSIEQMDIDFPDYDETGSDLISGKPGYWYQEHATDTNFRLFPAPDSNSASKTIKIKFVKKLTDLSADSDDLFDGKYTQYHMVVIYAALIELFYQRGDSVQARENERRFDAALGKLESALTKKEIPGSFQPAVSVRFQDGRFPLRQSGAHWDWGL